MRIRRERSEVPEAQPTGQPPERPPRGAPTTRRSSVALGVYAIFATIVISTAAFFSIQAASGSQDLRAKLTLIAPAAPGGGWDGFAREQQQAMRANNLVNSVQVVNIPGAGGTIGLGKLSTLEGEGSTLMVGGTGLTAAAIQLRSPVALADMTPIARVVEEYNVVVVPASSQYQTLQELIDAWRADPQAVVWTGGGSFDQLVATSIALAAGVEPTQMAYVPVSGGGEVAQALMNGTAQATTSGYADLADQIQAGRLRALGLAAPERMANSEIPTLRESGYDVTLANWRALLRLRESPNSSVQIS